jgi:hypothetical protein
MFIPNREELAWAAGFYDGEGSLSISPANNTTIKMDISQNDRDVLDRFYNAVGGRGKVYGPYGRYRPNDLSNNPYWVFVVSNFQDAQAVIVMIWPFLSTIKRAQAAKALTTMRDHIQRMDSWRNGQTSKAKNVYWDKSRNKWLARIRIAGIRINLGRFDSEDAAIDAVASFTASNEIEWQHV